MTVPSGAVGTNDRKRFGAGSDCPGEATPASGALEDMSKFGTGEPQSLRASI